SLCNFCWIGARCVWLRRRQLRNRVGYILKVLVGQSFCDVVHNFEVALFLTEEIELNQNKGGGLSSKRRHLGILRLAFFSMTGKAWRHAFFQRPSRCTRCSKHHCSNDDLTHASLSNSNLCPLAHWYVCTRLL